MSKRPNKRNLQHRTANEDGNVEYLRKQTRFGSETQIQGRNNLNNCLLCGVSFKRGGVVHKVVKSAKGVRVHLCSDCAKGYPNAREYVTSRTVKLESKPCINY